MPFIFWNTRLRTLFQFWVGMIPLIIAAVLNQMYYVVKE